MLRQVSELSGGLDEAVHLSDWAALMDLPRPCSSSNTQGESEAEIDEEDSDPGDAGDETTSDDRMPQWKVDHSSGDHKLQGKLAGREGWQEETDDI